MSSKTKIIVLRMKEIIYTAIFLGFALILVLLLLYMLRPVKNDSSGMETPSGTQVTSEAASYTPGSYSSSVTLGSQSANVEVTVDANRITSIALVPLNDSVAAMNPLREPTMETLSSQILEKQSLEGLEYPAGAQYTSVTLMQAVEAAVEKAKPE